MILALFFVCLLSLGTRAHPSCGLIPPRNAVNIHTQTASLTEEVLVTAWYPGWLSDQFPPSSLSWNKYTAMTFAFAVTNPDGSVSLDSQSQAVLPQFVSMAKSFNVSALLSVGGWTGSQYFSTAVATPGNRSAFVKTITSLAATYNLDGIDFDWEYPNRQGIGCNTISSKDSSNLLLFLQELKGDPVGKDLTLTAAVGLTPFVGEDGDPMNDVSEFAQVLDHIAIMNYDVWGDWSNAVGPNAPLNDSCAPPNMQEGSAVSAVQAWTDAGFPAGQIALGVAAYGHSFHVSGANAINSKSGQLTLYPPFDKSQQPMGDSADDSPDPNNTAGQLDQCGNAVSSQPSGIFNFNGLVQGGFLDSNGTALAGIDYVYDDCSQTPFVYNPKTDVMISFDDAKSFAAKGRFINEAGLKGFAMWHAAGDSHDILMDAISDAMNIQYICS